MEYSLGLLKVLVAMDDGLLHYRVNWIHDVCVLGRGGKEGSRRGCAGNLQGGNASGIQNPKEDRSVVGLFCVMEHCR
jgi:hypothetical protein